MNNKISELDSNLTLLSEALRKRFSFDNFMPFDRLLGEELSVRLTR
jgi:hypothetical protein